MTKKCYVGMTTNLARRKKEHQANYSGMYNWKEYGPFFIRALAQQKEDELAAHLGCHANPGGPDVPDAVWYVYSFSYEE